jgi:hypothetical protein
MGVFVVALREMLRWDGCGWSGCVMGWLGGTVGDEEVVELMLWTLDATVP